MIVLLALSVVLILLNKYRQKIAEELSEFVNRKLGLAFGIFLAALSISFIAQTDNLLVLIASAGLTIIAVIMILVFFIPQLKKIPKT